MAIKGHTEVEVNLYQSLLHSLLQNIKQNSLAWYGIMGDEASDIANREQLNISIRWVNEFYEISEDPVGLFCLTNTTADTICIAIKDILIHCSLPLSLYRGQTYDGASNMQGYKKVFLLKLNVKAHLHFQCIVLLISLIYVYRM